MSPAHRAPASPLEACEGYFKVNSSAGEVWLHETDRGCTVGLDDFVIRSDGSAEELGASERKGTWKGDELYFQIFVDGYTLAFSRLPAEPRK